MATSNYMRWIAFLLLVFLSACGEDPASSNYGYGYHYDEVDEPSGIRVRHGQEQYTLGEVVEAYRWVESCIGLTAPGPLVIFTTEPILDENNTVVAGMYYSATKTAIISSNPGVYGKDVIKHEFIHHILGVNGASNNDNNGHGSIYFTICRHRN